jgi:Protein of unknown function (DUF1353)
MQPGAVPRPGTILPMPSSRSPKRFTDILPRWGTYSGAALIHDWLYRTRPPGVTRREADRVFLELMLEDGVPLDQARLMHQAVRWFGDKAWNDRRATTPVVATREAAPGIALSCSLALDGVPREPSRPDMSQGGTAPV